MTTHPDLEYRDRVRRGMLLLMVVSMLSLFLLVGTLAIVMATRSREAARAFAGFTAGSTQLSVVARTAADEALLTLIRGTTNPTVRAQVTESLLGDMYGTGTNGRFVDEPYDGFDNENQFLTRLTLGTNGVVASTPRPAFQKTGTALPIEVDNDGDGIPDGVWLKDVLPPVILPAGEQFKFDVSYLVLDLDGRINVNAHGRRSDDLRASTDPEGPADVDGLTIVGGTTPWNLLLSRSGSQCPSGTAAPSLQWRPPPTLTSQVVDGRFGSGTSSKTYDLRLDLEAPRPSMLAGAVGQNPFTLGELERVLRQFDPDAGTLPPRLAALLGDHAERSRMRITTDSWDVPGQRANVKWAAPNAGVPDEVAFWTQVVPFIVAAGASQTEAEQWVANVVEFRDKDNSANTPFPNGIKGVEPSAIPINGPWNLGYFLSPAQVFGVPMGTEKDIKDLLAANLPVTSLADKYPRILEMVTIPSFFAATRAADPAREPGRINVNTCDDSVWNALTGKTGNPYNNSSDNPAKPAKNTLALLKDNVLAPPTNDVTTMNHSLANRLGNIATVRSYVFAVWISIRVTHASATGDSLSCYRLFAIVDRSIPVTYVEGQNNNVRDMIRLQRFLN